MLRIGKSKECVCLKFIVGFVFKVYVWEFIKDELLFVL